jgi:hypothetical protein
MTKDIATQVADIGTAVAVLATRLQSVEDVLSEGIKNVTKFTQKTIEEKTEAALLGQKMVLGLEKVVESVAAIKTDFDTHKVEQQKRLRLVEQKIHVALVWLAFLTILVVAVLLLIASGADAAKTAGEFTGGMVKSFKP